MNKPLRFALLMFLAGTLTVGSVLADRITLPRPIRTLVYKKDKTALAGRVPDYDLDTFTLIDGKGQSHDVAWTDLEAHSEFQLRAMLIGAKSADPWVQLGKDLLARGDAADWAQRAFDRALRIDPKVKDQIADIQKQPPAGNSIDGGGPTLNSVAGQTGMAGAAGGPKISGAIVSRYWGKQSDADQADAVTQLKQFADLTIQTMHHSLSLSETSYFLFYTDLDPREADKWASLLDLMYGKLSATFGVKPGENIWRGKALVFVFKNAADYRNFETQMHHTDSGGSAGMCHCFGDGMVHIAFYREPQELQFAHVLVHESVHGFVHRYRSPIFIPSWINEGLAEAISTDMVHDPARESAILAARDELQDHGNNLGAFFNTRHIDWWQYPVAQAMCEFMLKESKPNYVAFINGIKDGLSVPDSMDQKYKAPAPRLLAGFSQYLATNALKADPPTATSK